MKALKKVTAVLPQIFSTGPLEGLDATAASHTFEELRRLRGKVKLSIDIHQLRRD